MNRLNNTQQQNLITLVCFNDEYCGVVRGNVESTHFDGDYQRIASAAYDYIDQYGEAPKVHTDDLLEQIARDDDDRENLLMIGKQMNAIKDGLNAQWVVRQIERFVKFQSQKDTIIKAAEKLETQEPSDQLLEEVDHLFTSVAKRKSLDVFDSGVSLVDTNALAFLDEEVDAFPTGIDILDRYAIGPARQELHLFIGASGRGKSWWFAHLAREAMLQRHKVLYVTLELNWKIAAQRFLQSILGIKKMSTTAPRLVFTTDGPSPERQYITDLNLYDYDDSGLSIESDPEQVRRKVRRDQRRAHRWLKNVMIKQFPTGKLSTAGLESYLDSLEMQTGFVPDLILVDYPDLMDVRAEYKREDLGKIYTELRGIGAERNMGIAAVTQSNREGAKGKHVRSTDVGEDWSKVHTADNVLTYSQTDIENSLQLARLRVDKARNSQDGMEIMISQNYNKGAFVEESVVLSDYNQRLIDGMLAEQQKEMEGEN